MSGKSVSNLSVMKRFYGLERFDAGDLCGSGGNVGERGLPGDCQEKADFILENLQKDGYLLRTYKDGRGKLNAYLEDYANFADGLLELFQVSGEIKYLSEAKRIVDTMIAEFWDETGGGFFFTGNNHEQLIVRKKDFYDNATPSGNSAAADVLLKLSKSSVKRNMSV